MCAQGEKVWFSQLTNARISNERKGKFDFEKSVKLTYNNPSSTFLRIALAAFEVASVERAKEKSESQMCAFIVVAFMFKVKSQQRRRRSQFRWWRAMPSLNNQECFLCQTSAANLCPHCGLVYYCSTVHFNLHRVTLKEVRLYYSIVLSMHTIL